MKIDEKELKRLALEKYPDAKYGFSYIDTLKAAAYIQGFKDAIKMLRDNMDKIIDIKKENIQ